MKTSKFTDERIAMAVRQADVHRGLERLTTRHPCGRAPDCDSDRH
jgi:hypothetical protein